MASPAPSPQSARPADAEDIAEAQSCPLCMEPFETTAAAAAGGVQSDRRPRVLGCGHSFCGSCLHEDMQQRRCCAICKAAIAQPNAAAVPINFDLIVSVAQMAALRLQVAQAQQQQPQQPQPPREMPATQCSECDAAATVYCEECRDDFCAEHSQQLHSLRRNKDHALMATASKAEAIALAAKRDARLLASRCSMHSGLALCLYCEDCAVALCAMCVQGKLHSQHSKVEIAAAAAKMRQDQAAQLAAMEGSGGDGEFGTLSAITKLVPQLHEAKQTIDSSADQAERDLAASFSAVRAALDAREAQLRQQLQQRRESATAHIDQLLTASDRALAAVAQLRDSVAALDPSDDHATLWNALHIVQLSATAKLDLAALTQQAASNEDLRACMISLRLDTTGESAALAAAASMCAITEEAQQIPVDLGWMVLDSPLLPRAQLSTLRAFFGDILMPVQPLYRASRDGFELEDWKARCLGKGPTMTLVQAKDSDFVFGAYTHCKWPAAADGVVADPSGRSFLFSLVNATGKALRFSLRHKDYAIQLGSSSVSFGAYTSDANGAVQTRSNFFLMLNGCSADQPKGNAASSINARSSYQPDDAAVQCDATFFAGQQYFAAAEIEVYEL